MNRSPVIAGVLSVVVPGLGHLYAGATSRGLALGAGFVALVQAATAHATGFAVPALLLVWLFGIMDAVRVTEEIVRARAAGREPAVGLDRRWAAGLVAVGVVAVISLVEELAWALRLWPLVLVWIGVRLLQGRWVIPDGSIGELVNSVKSRNRPPDPPTDQKTAPDPPPAAPGPPDPPTAPAAAPAPRAAAADPPSAEDGPDAPASHREENA